MKNKAGLFRKDKKKAKRSLGFFVREFVIKRSLLLILLMIALTGIVYQVEVHRYVNRYIENRTASFEEFIRSNQQELKNYAEMHCHWDELIANIDQGNGEWIDKNASGYLVEEAVFNVDFVYIRDEKTGYENLAGIDEKGSEELLAHAQYFKGLRDFDEDIYWIGDSLYLVNGGYLSSDNKIENRGFYFIGRKMDAEVLTALRSAMNVDMIQKIEQKEADEGIQYPAFLSTQIAFSVPITREGAQQDWYLRFIYQLDYLMEFYYAGEIVLIAFFLYFAVCVSADIIRKISLYSCRLKWFEGEVKLMSKGLYDMQFDEVGIKEFDSLMGSMNLLSSNLKAYRSKVRRDQVEMIELLVKAVDINDHYTKGHSERVAKMAKRLAGLIGYPEPEKIELAGLLHDVGKISVPTHILNKPGRLTEREYKRIQQHADKGCELLKKSGAFDEIRDVVRFHHERIDGKGYPLGLVGEQIPVEALLISICDVYDALVTDRPYREAMSHEEAMKIIIGEKGRAFPETLVMSFELLFEEVGIEGFEQERVYEA